MADWQTWHDRSPYVNQDVLYRSRGSADGVYKSVDRAAKITEVVNDNCELPIVKLMIFNPTGIFFHEQVSNGTGLGEWRAMPLREPNAP